MNGIFDLRSRRGIVFLCYCLLIVLTLVFIFNNSSYSREESAAQSQSLAEILKSFFDPHNKLTPDEFEHLIRKLAHFAEFGLLGFEFALLAFHVSEGFKLRDAIYSAFACLLTANFDEFFQSFTQRGSKVSDVFIDFSGSVCGIAAAYVAAITIRAIYRKSKAKKALTK